MTLTHTPDPQAATAPQPCPRCGAPMPTHSHYVTWCAQCNWNLSPAEQPAPRTLFESFYARLGARLSAQMFEAIKRRATLAPQLSASLILAYGLAALVHAATLLCLILGVASFFSTLALPFRIIFGVALLLTAWQLRPRSCPLPDDIAAPAQFPTLYAVANRIAGALGAAPVRLLAIDEQFNASYGRAGWQQRPLITVGLPLFAILTPQEQVAVLAHEIAHGVNGDLNRQRFIGTAISSLAEWYAMLRPSRLLQSRIGTLEYIMGNIVNLVMRALSYIPWLLAYALCHLLWRNAQRAEYFADQLAARASGTPAMLSALEKLHYSGAAQISAQTIALRDRNRSVIASVRDQVAAMPAHELERIRRSEVLEASRLDASHPPTAYRIALLQAHPAEQPQVFISEAEAAQLERELAQVEPGIQRALIDSYRRRLYA